MTWSRSACNGCWDLFTSSTMNIKPFCWVVLTRCLWARCCSQSSPISYGWGQGETDEVSSAWETQPSSAWLLALWITWISRTLKSSDGEPEMFQSGELMQQSLPSNGHREGSNFYTLLGKKNGKWSLVVIVRQRQTEEVVSTARFWFLKTTPPGSILHLKRKRNPYSGAWTPNHRIRINTNKSSLVFSKLPQSVFSPFGSLFHQLTVNAVF